MDFEKLMQPLTINGMTLKNRVMMTPMGTNLANPDGSISEAHKQYYRQRAKGGTGLIVVENVCVDFPMGSNGTTQLRLDHDSFIPHLYELTEDLHRYGTKVAIQINHAGGAARSSRIGAQPASASDIPPKTGGEKPRPFTREEILHLVKCFGDSAKRAQMAGFDAVEIHAGHSYLLHQFISPTTNNRTDEFGGTQEKFQIDCRNIGVSDFYFLYAGAGLRPLSCDRAREAWHVCRTWPGYSGRVLWRRGSLSGNISDDCGDDKI